ncbi:hypothetical protein [Acetobacter sp. A11-2]|uniref:hypothetical protein n=1 Tax=Acetobacter sp. A11-2 TaxID=3157859 RepID=UPI0032EFDF76
MFQTKAYNGQPIVISPNILDRRWLIMDTLAGGKPLLIVFEASGRVLNGSLWVGKQWRIENHHLIILDKEGNVKYRSLQVYEDKEILLYDVEGRKEIKLLFDGFFDLENLLKNQKSREVVQPHSKNFNHIQTISGGKIIRYERIVNMDENK